MWICFCVGATLSAVGDWFWHLLDFSVRHFSLTINVNTSYSSSWINCLVFCDCWESHSIQAYRRVLIVPQWAVMYVCARCINFAPYSNLSLDFWKIFTVCVVLFSFFFSILLPYMTIHILKFPIFVGINFREWTDIEMFGVLILVNDFFCNICLSWCAKFRRLQILTKTT